MVEKLSSFSWWPAATLKLALVAMKLTYCTKVVECSHLVCPEVGNWWWQVTQVVDIDEDGNTVDSLLVVGGAHVIEIEAHRWWFCKRFLCWIFCVGDVTVYVVVVEQIL